VILVDESLHNQKCRKKVLEVSFVFPNMVGFGSFDQEVNKMSRKRVGVMVLIVCLMAGVILGGCAPGELEER